MQLQKISHFTLFFSISPIQNNTGKITVDTLGAVTTTPTMSPKPTQAPTSLSACLGDPSNVAVQVDVTTDVSDLML